MTSNMPILGASDDLPFKWKHASADCHSTLNRSIPRYFVFSCCIWIWLLEFDSFFLQWHILVISHWVRITASGCWKLSQPVFFQRAHDALHGFGCWRSLSGSLVITYHVLSHPRKTCKIRSTVKPRNASNLFCDCSARQANVSNKF